MNIKEERKKAMNLFLTILSVMTIGTLGLVVLLYILTS